MSVPSSELDPYYRVPECLSLRLNWIPIIEYQSVCPVVGIENPVPPPPLASVSPPLDPKGGGGWQHALEGGKPIPTTGQKAWHSVHSLMGPRTRPNSITIMPAVPIKLYRDKHVPADTRTPGPRQRPGRVLYQRAS